MRRLDSKGKYVFGRKRRREGWDGSKGRMAGWLARWLAGGIDGFAMMV